MGLYINMCSSRFPVEWGGVAGVCNFYDKVDCQLMRGSGNKKVHSDYLRVYKINH